LNGEIRSGFYRISDAGVACAVAAEFEIMKFTVDSDR
jgi:hypothetical protein